MKNQNIVKLEIFKNSSHRITRKNYTNFLYFLPIFLLFFFNSSCSMAPKYKTPETGISELEKEDKSNIKKYSWQDFFKSKDLQEIINLSLKNNANLKIANLNVEIAMQEHNVVRASLMPSINSNASMTRQGVPNAFSSFNPKQQYRAGIFISSFELDFFGRIKSLKDAALESFLATESAKNITKISLINTVANSYFQFLLDKELLDLAKQNLEIAKESNKIVEAQYDHGIASKTKLLESKSLLEEARKKYDSYKNLLERDKTSLMLLCGKFDENILSKNSSLENVEIDENLINFVPSKTLLLRPDIQQAEHNLKSANANIGAARAAFFPIISLTGSAGYASRDLSNLFQSKNWNYTPQISLPIFSGGRNFANLEISHLRKKSQIVEYERVVQNAFKEALDEIENKKMIVSQLESSLKIFESQKEIFKISLSKYENEIENKLTMLANQRNFLISEELYLITKKDRLVNLSNLFKVFGGDHLEK